LLAVEELRVTFATRRGRVDAVRGVGFSLSAGECLAIVGESGSGKSVTARALVGLVGAGSTVSATRMTLGERDLTAVSDREWEGIRGRQIGLVLPDALGALDPVRRVGAEIAETLQNHRVVPRADRPARVVSLLEQARVPEPTVRARQFPHQLSGGLRQRALIASAMAANPAVLLADEPTTALDLTVQAEILDLLGTMKAAGTAILLISHDLSVVAQLADRVAVMRDGVFVEQDTTQAVLQSPSHPYTKQLLAAVPSPRDTGRTQDATARTVLEAGGMSKSFAGRAAVRDVSFSLRAGEILGVVGESGAGKTTVARLLLGLLEPDAGQVTLLEQPWSGQPESRRRPVRHRIQLVQQDPLSSFDPRYTVERIVAEALGAPARKRRTEIVELLHLVGLDAKLLDRHPRQMSGGQRQRVAIARALAPRPDVIVCDEPVSALDVSIQAQILELFERLRAVSGAGFLFISHDLGVIQQCSDRVLVMQGGQVVESGPVDDVFRRPRHPYTRTLLAALPISRPGSTSVHKPAKPARRGEHTR
jgi:peptide/nickel transport system ATP-binding protein